jgi:hypothetical protein
MGSDGTIYIYIYTPSFMNIGTDVEVILRFCLRNMRGCDVGITEGEDL